MRAALLSLCLCVALLRPAHGQGQELPPDLAAMLDAIAAVATDVRQLRQENLSLMSEIVALRLQLLTIESQVTILRSISGIDPKQSCCSSFVNGQPSKKGKAQ